ncbi:hypothetical protein ACQ5SO_09730 [Rhodovulum sp. DZ06]|uniref:hypothetical protein n=1 Tax=Rhodovulum sp. DZ06 TaxID=3425126 RepID=UPI003D3288FC
MAHETTVIRSINLGGDMGGETICVDLFRRPDGSFGFDEFRRDPEGGRGRCSIGHPGAARFESAEDALAAAKAAVGWLADAG